MGSTQSISVGSIFLLIGTIWQQNVQQQRRHKRFLVQQFLENAAGSLRRVASSFCKAKSNSNQNNTPYKKQSKQATAFCACLKIHRNIQPISKKNRKNNVVTQQRKMRSKANSAAPLPVCYRKVPFRIGCFPVKIK